MLTDHTNVTVKKVCWWQNSPLDKGHFITGIEPAQNKSDQERYQEVLELLFDRGVLLDEADITASWNAVCEKQKGQPEDYWWEAKDNNYFHLMNYDFMGVRSDSD